MPPLECVSPDDVQDHVEARVAIGPAPGVACGMALRDGEDVVACAGLADVEAERALTPSTLVPWFSVTKIFTAIAVVRLLEERRHGLDFELGSLLGPLPTPLRAARVTVRHLLSHTSGLDNPIPVGWIHRPNEDGPGLDELAARLLVRYPPLWAPGERLVYSNLNYVLLGQLIERLSGVRYEDYIRRVILEPLGLRDTGFGYSAAAPALGYQARRSWLGVATRLLVDRRFLGEPSRGLIPVLPFLVDGAPYGGLIGTLRDLLRFGAACLEPWRLEAAGVLSADAARRMFVPTRTSMGRALQVGLGWFLGTVGGERFVHHPGRGGGFRVELRLYPRLGQVTAVVGNETSFDTNSLARLVLAPRLA